MGKTQTKSAPTEPPSQIVPILEARMIWRQVGGRSGARDVTGDPDIFEAYHNRIEVLIQRRVEWDKAVAAGGDVDALGPRP